MTTTAPRDGARRASPRVVHRAAMATWTTRLVALTGAVMLVGALMPTGPRRQEVLSELVPELWSTTAGVVAAATGALLLVLSAGLRRRKHAAWLAVLTLSALAMVLDVAEGLDVEAAALSALCLVALIATRREFVALPDRRTRWLAPVAGAAVAAGGLAVATAILLVRGQHLLGTPTLLARVAEAALGLVGLAGPVRFADTATARAVALTAGASGLTGLAVTAWLLLRPSRADGITTAEAEDRLRALLARHGRRDSLGYFALRRDKYVVFSPSGKAAVTYRAIGGVSLASGDPIGDVEAWPGAIEAWLAEARAHGWIPGVLGCSETAGHAYTRHGLLAMELGDEAVLEAADFTLDGRALRGVRQAVARVERAGHTAAVARTGDLGPAALEEARQAAEDFRDGDVERGFSMALSRLGDPADPDCVLVLARDRHGAVRGLLHFVPWGPDGLSLDLMRRDADADNGLLEFLVVTLLRAAPGLGVTRVSLNFAVFRSTFARGERLGAGPVLRAWRRLLLLASRFWQIESLYRANAKYHPSWEPRFVCYPTARDLPRIGVAALRAEAFLVAPFSRRLPRPAASRTASGTAPRTVRPPRAARCAFPVRSHARPRSPG
jgi:lysyl-tRNA synthetase class 2